MRSKTYMPDCGVQIENTLSVSLQKRRLKRRPIYMVLIAASGAFGSIFSFLSMFELTFNAPVLVFSMFILLGIMSFTALTPGKYRIIKLSLYSCCLLMTYFLRKVLFCGFACLMNSVYGCINETDRMYFQIESGLSQSTSCTVFLIFASAVIIYLLCFAVLRFHNFFLSFLATFPYVEIGLFFGFVPSHTFACLMLSFWCGMAAVHLAEFGSYRTRDKSGFLRRKNTFFPVSGMHLMVTEHIGFMVLIAVFLLSGIVRMGIQMSHYTRNEKVKQLRTDFIYYCENFSFESTMLDAFEFLGGNSQNDAVIRLGRDEKREFENISIATVDMTDLPQSRIYLKSYTGSVYHRNRWEQLPPASFRNSLFSSFAQLNFYPQDYPYTAMEYSGFDTPITLTYKGDSDILDSCVPYGIRREPEMTCKEDNGYSSFRDQYTIYAQTDYEAFLKWADIEKRTADALVIAAPSVSVPVLQERMDTIMHPDAAWIILPESEKKAEASSFCLLGYTDFARENYLEVPDTNAMDEVRNAYGDLLDGFDGSTASPAETIAFLETLRARICSSVSYSLVPGKTPAGADFVQYFLLDNQKGYCVHYATAGTILARMAGIPARYCEGYLMDCSRDKITMQNETEDSLYPYSMEILDRNAHAWAEIYIEGMGWIPFEFTYTYFDPPEEPATEPSFVEPVPETQPPTVPPVMQNPATETDTALEKETQPSPFKSDTPVKKYRQSAAPALVYIIIGITLLLLIFIGCILLLRKQALSRRRQQFSQPDMQKAAQSISLYLMRMLQYCGVPKDVLSVSALAEEADRIGRKYLKRHDITAAVSVMAKLKYDQEPITKEELQCLRSTASELAFGIYRNASVMKKIWIQWGLHFV